MEQPMSFRVDEVIELVAAETGIDAGLLHGDETLRNLGVNSFTMMQLIMRLEEQFSLELSPEELVAVFRLSGPGLGELVERNLASSD